MPDQNAPPRARLRLIDNWRREIWRLWSVRVAAGGAAFWAAMSFAYVLWPALLDRVPFWFYAVGGVIVSILLAWARLLKQPGADL